MRRTNNRKYKKKFFVYRHFKGFFPFKDCETSNVWKAAFCNSLSRSTVAAINLVHTSTWNFGLNLHKIAKNIKLFFVIARGEIELFWYFFEIPYWNFWGHWGQKLLRSKVVESSTFEILTPKKSLETDFNLKNNGSWFFIVLIFAPWRPYGRIKKNITREFSSPHRC